MAQMEKVHVALEPNQVKALSLIEAETDRPRTRVIRRAVTDFLKKYADEHPGFLERVGGSIESEGERELKPGLETDNVVIRGIKKLVIVTKDGWRNPTNEDYVDGGASAQPVQSSILDEVKG